MRAFETPQVAAAFERFEPEAREGLLALRGLIFEVADELKVTVTEALRWGQPAYLTTKGSTLRLGVPKKGGFALFAHCQTDIISSFAAQAGAGYRFDGNRGVLFGAWGDVRLDELRPLVRHGLTYHAV